MRQFITILAFTLLSVPSIFSQNIGVNTDGSTPQSLFHLHHQAYAAGTPLFQVTNNTTGNGSNALGLTIDFDANIDISFKNRYNNAGSGFAFYTNNGSLTEKVTILNSGFFGILDATPIQPLVVNGDAHIGGSSGDEDGQSEFIKIWAQTGDYWTLGVLNTALQSTTDFFIGHNDDGNDGIFHIEYDGSVSIGTTVPETWSLLQVNLAAADDAVYIKNTDALTNNNAVFRIAANSGIPNAMRVQRNGYTGIGVSPALYWLHAENTDADDPIGYFKNTVASNEAVGVWGECANTDYYGKGGYFKGGYVGAYGEVVATGANYYYGIYGKATGSTGYNYGVSGRAIGGTGNNRGVYGYAEVSGCYGVFGSVSVSDGAGVRASNSHVDGTGIVASGNNASGTYLVAGSGGAFTGEDGMVGYGNLAAGTGVVGAGNNQVATTLVNGSGVSGNGIICGVYGLADNAAGAGVLGQNNNVAGWAGDFQGHTKIGTSTSDIHNFWGYFQSAGASDLHRLVSATNNYGYVGFSGRDWWRGYSNSWTTSSRKSEKRDIKYLSDYDLDMLMKDIENTPLAYYKFKVEEDEFIKGKEAKFAPMPRLGTFVSEAPDYVKDNAFSGISLYEYSSLIMAGVKHNRNSIKEMKASVNDFGTAKMNGKIVKVEFSDRFSEKINEHGIPVVTVSPLMKSASIFITEITTKGFTIESDIVVDDLMISWIAMGETGTGDEVTDEELNKYKQDNQLAVPESVKDLMRDWVKAENKRADDISSERNGYQKDNATKSPVITKSAKKIINEENESEEKKINEQNKKSTTEPITGG